MGIVVIDNEADALIRQIGIIGAQTVVQYFGLVPHGIVTRLFENGSVNVVLPRLVKKSVASHFRNRDGRPAEENAQEDREGSS